MSPVLVNNQGQGYLHETKLVAVSRPGLPYHLPRSLKNLMLQGRPFHLKVQEVRKPQSKPIAQEATKVYYYLWPIP